MAEINTKIPSTVFENFLTPMAYGILAMYSKNSDQLTLLSAGDQ
jgi:hypothetical protein